MLFITLFKTKGEIRMAIFKVKYIRNVTEIYEAEIESETEDDVINIINQSKYGDEIKGEKLVNTYSDEIEIDEINQIDEQVK